MDALTKTKFTSIIKTLTRAKTEFLITQAAALKLQQLSDKIYSEKELKALMDTIPHFDNGEKMMMIKTYSQQQLITMYREVFMAKFNEFKSFKLEELHFIYLSYLEIATDYDLANYARALSQSQGKVNL